MSNVSIGYLIGGLAAVGMIALGFSVLSVFVGILVGWLVMQVRIPDSWS